MNRNQASAWLKRLFGSLAGSAELLAPHTGNCAVCRKPISRSTSAAPSPSIPSLLGRSLCSSCLSAIPWLTRIACLRCGRGIPCDDCVRQPRKSFICNRSAVQYDHAMKSWLAQYKYRGNEELGPLLGAMLFPAFEQLSYQLGADLSRNEAGGCWDAVAYVPVSKEREAERGFNQAEQLAACLARQYRLPLLPLLSRERHTGKQSFKTRSERMKDMKELFKTDPSSIRKLEQILSSGIPQQSAMKAVNFTSFARNRPEGPVRKHSRIVLIDDIYTTGSTAEACAEELLAGCGFPLDIFVLTWARS